MARTATIQAQPAALTEEQEVVLQAHHEFKIRDALREADKAAAAAKTARKAVSSAYKRMTADMLVPRYKFEDYLADKDKDEDEFLASEAQRRKLHRNGGLPIGAQQELLLGDTADDAARTYAAGQRAYMDFAEPVPPSEISPAFHSDWMRGFNDKMAEVIAGATMAEVLEAARAPQPVMTAGADPDEPEEGEEEEDAPLDEAAITASARALKGSGWTEPTADEEKVAA